MKILLLSLFVVTLPSVYANDYSPSKSEIAKAKEIAVEASEWFSYTTGKVGSEHEGQCGDYALMFVLNFNNFIGKNVARLVVANNPVKSGTYKVGKKVDVKKLGFDGFPSGGSGFLLWNKQLYLYHPILGAYQLYLDRAWTPKKHFGVNMLDKRQVHVWAAIGNVSVDPTYYDLWPNQFPTPIGKDE